MNKMITIHEIQVICEDSTITIGYRVLNTPHHTTPHKAWTLNYTTQTTQINNITYLLNILHLNIHYIFIVPYNHYKSQRVVHHAPTLY